MKKTILYFSFLLILMGCKKDLLTEDLAPLEGRFEWEYSYYWDPNCLLCSNGNNRYRYPSDDGYTASIEFREKNKVRFYIDNEEITERPFKVIDKQKNDGKLYLEMKVDVRKKDLDINDNIELIYYNDTLEIDEFPHNGFSGESHGSNYFIRK